jgi:hypothetical protein
MGERMKILKLSLLSGLLPIFLFLRVAAQETYSLVHIDISSKSEVAAIMTEIGADECGMKYDPAEGYLELCLNSSEINSVSRLGYNYEIIIPDLEKYYSNRNIGLTMGGFRTYSEIGAKIDSLQDSYPAILRVDSIGVSHQNNTIWAVKISDNVNLEEGEPEVLFTGITHAREPIGGAICIDFMEWLCLNYGEDPDATYIVDNRQVWFIPVVNPDGYLYNQNTNPNGGGMWRKNRRNNGGSYGVDNNRNYTYMWGFDDYGSSPVPSSETYRGPFAGSEPEDQAVIQLCEDHNFRLAIHYHSGAETILQAWGYDDIFTPDHHFYRSLGDSLSVFSGYPVGTTWQQLYPSNGNAYDYSYGEIVTKNRIFGFVCEAGDFWPNQSSIPGLVNIHRNYCRVFAELADNIWRGTPPGGPQIQPMDTSYTGFTLSPGIWSPATPFPQVRAAAGIGRIDYHDGAEDGSGNWILDGFSVSTTHHSGSWLLFRECQQLPLRNDPRFSRAHKRPDQPDLLYQLQYRKQL